MLNNWLKAMLRRKSRRPRLKARILAGDSPEEVEGQD